MANYVWFMLLVVTRILITTLYTVIYYHIKLCMNHANSCYLILYCIDSMCLNMAVEAGILTVSISSIVNAKCIPFCPPAVLHASVTCWAPSRGRMAPWPKSWCPIFHWPWSIWTDYCYQRRPPRSSTAAVSWGHTRCTLQPSHTISICHIVSIWVKLSVIVT